MMGMTEKLAAGDAHSPLTAEGLRLHLIGLDRGGVLNHNVDHGVRRVEDWDWVAGSVEAVRPLASYCFQIKFLTNQCPTL